MRSLKFRPSLAEQRRRNQAALEALRIGSYREDAPQLDTGAKPKREPRPTSGPRESQVLDAVRAYLRMHPAVAWVARINRGGATDEKGHFVQFNTIAGCSDLIGQLKTGHFLACEVKRPGEKPTEPQMLFLRMVEQHGGCAGWADSVEAVQRMMREWADRSR